MKNEWILDVLADLKSFAQKNDYSALAEQIAITADLAATEIASTEYKALPTYGDEQKLGRHSGEIGNSASA